MEASPASCPSAVVAGGIIRGPIGLGYSRVIAWGGCRESNPPVNNWNMTPLDLLSLHMGERPSSQTNVVALANPSGFLVLELCG